MICFDKLWEEDWKALFGLIIDFGLMDGICVKFDGVQKQLILNIALETSNEALKNQYFDKINDTDSFKSRLQDDLSKSNIDEIKDCKINSVSSPTATEDSKDVDGKFGSH